MNVTRVRSCLLQATAITLFALVGCQKPDLSEMMKDPERPEQLNQLNMFVGEWTSTARSEMPDSDEVLNSRGRNTIEWAADDRVLVERWESTMDSGESISGVSIWTWDETAGHYRLWDFDSHGSVSTGKATWDDETGTWNVTMDARNLVTGDTYRMAGTMTARTGEMDWSWSLLGPFGGKMFTFTGTSERR